MILLYFVQNCCAIFVAIAAANNKVVTALCLSSRWVFYIYFEIHFWCGKQKKKKSIKSRLVWCVRLCSILTAARCNHYNNFRFKPLAYRDDDDGNFMNQNHCGLYFH